MQWAYELIPANKYLHVPYLEWGERKQGWYELKIRRDRNHMPENSLCGTNQISRSNTLGPAASVTLQCGQFGVQSTWNQNHNIDDNDKEARTRGERIGMKKINGSEFVLRGTVRRYVSTPSNHCSVHKAMQWA